MKPVVVLDIDGVLVDGDAPHECAVRAMCNELARPLLDSEYQQMMFMSQEDQYKNLPEDVKQKIDFKTFESEIERRTNEIVDAEGFKVLPGAAELVKEIYLNKMPVICCTSGQGGMPAKKIEAVLKAVNALLPAHIPPLENLPIIKREDLEAHGTSKSNPDAYKIAAREAIKLTYGFKSGYHRKNFMQNDVVIIEDANIPVARKSGAKLVIQMKFMNKERQPEAHLFLHNLTTSRIMASIIAKRNVRRRDVKKHRAHIPFL
jgi:beta-phosphoglucomutase-like phosphatase (HAD superfamily)